MELYKPSYILLKELYQRAEHILNIGLSSEKIFSETFTVKGWIR